MRRVLLSLVLLVAILVTSCAGPATPTVAPTKPAAAQPTTVAAKPTDTTAPKPTNTTAPAASGPALPKVNPLDVKGDIISAGSSTVFPLSERIAVLFADEGYKGKITIDSIGSGAGLERFCKAGETDIANASRKIKDSEIANCKTINREPVEFRVGTDALAVVVSKENTFLTDVTVAELAKIFANTTTKWNEVNPAWPDQPIKRFIPGTDSGTFDYFVEVVFATKKELSLGAPNQQASEDDNVLVQGVLGSPYAIGYFGYAYYQENAAKMKVLSINGIAPTVENVDAAKYPLARPLFLYTTAKIMKDKPQVASFINYYLTNVNKVIRKVGYFSASDTALNAAKQAFLDATK
jgi:phosphate transport system substrate-binding protein